MSKIVIASKNPVKIEAARLGFQRMFPGMQFDLQGVSVPSGVPDQPLSNAQTLEGEKAAALLSGIRRHVRQILWLNTLPERRWLETSYVRAFLPSCQMYECYTLGHLTQILGKQFFID